MNGKVGNAYGPKESGGHRLKAAAGKRFAQVHPGAVALNPYAGTGAAGEHRYMCEG